MVNAIPEFDAERLIAEIRRYLVAVDAFRAEGREPTWRRESPSTRLDRG
jgi:hypothetical protein